ncbi:ROK family protein [Heyndrickxia sp. NPDC080065]|uniref:ROK family protein n=1 Tax=Heyndrickxia sp. NPDC080065 TaxID=3390568 RepID=UPI003D040F01
MEEEFQEVPLADGFTIDRFVEALVLNYPDIKALGIGIPGFVHQGVINVCDIAELRNVPLEAQLREKYELEVTVDNDMNLTAYGFYKNRTVMKTKR